MRQRFIRRQRGKRHQRRRRRGSTQIGGITPLVAGALGALSMPMLKMLGLG